jgi:hypothetical protein
MGSGLVRQLPAKPVGNRKFGGNGSPVVSTPEPDPPEISSRRRRE